MTTFGQVFAVPRFRVLFASQALLVSGDTVKMLAFSVLVYAQTGSPGLSAAAYMIGFIPQVLGGVLLLSIADRVRPRRLMIVGELLRVAVCVTLAAGGLPVWAALALVFVTGMPTPVFMAARNAMLPEVLAGDAFVLGRATIGVMVAGAQIAGFAGGGLVLAAIGAESALLVTAALSLISAAVLRLGLPDGPPRARREGAGGAGDGAKAGGPAGDAGTVRTTLRVNRALLADRRVRGLLLAGWLPPMFFVGAEAVFVPYLTGLGSASGAGLVLAATAAGMGLGDFVVGRFVSPEGRERLVFPLMLLLGAPLLGFAAQPGVAASAVLAAAGCACFAYNLGLQRPFVDAVPPERLGQAYGLQGAGVMTTQALGAAFAGGLAELVPPHHAIAWTGAAGIACALALRATVLRGLGGKGRLTPPGRAAESPPTPAR
jgi:predicted MFS family arabinose efflux permease